MTRIVSFPRTALPFLTVAALLASACGRTASRPPSSVSPAQARAGSAFTAPNGQAREAAADAAAPGTYQGPPAPAMAGAADESATRAYEPSPERPGLGTEWGETRASRVSSAPFEREDFETPLSVSSFFYNDEAGVRALLGSGYWERRSDGVSAAGGAITIRVVDDSGNSYPTFAAAGRSYVMGRDGAHYSIRIDNRSGARFEAVATVDGLDVIDGQPGSFEKRGYLLAPWSSVEIDGFRRSEDAVAAFRFGRVRDSYAAKRGDDRNVGVIGVAIFQERGYDWRWNQRELERRDSADAFPGRFAPPPAPGY